MQKFVNKWGESKPIILPKPKNNLSWHTMIGGTSNNDDNYKNKYLKYKNKYLKLKNIIQ